RGQENHGCGLARSIGHPSRARQINFRIKLDAVCVALAACCQRGSESRSRINTEFTGMRGLSGLARGVPLQTGPDMDTRPKLALAGKLLYPNHARLVLRLEAKAEPPKPQGLELTRHWKDGPHAFAFFKRADGQ